MIDYPVPRCQGYIVYVSLNLTPAAWPLLPDTGASRKVPPLAFTRSAKLAFAMVYHT